MTTIIQNINTTLALFMNYGKCHILLIMTASVLVINIYQVFIVCQAIRFAFEGNCLIFNDSLNLP